MTTYEAIALMILFSTFIVGLIGVIVKITVTLSNDKRK